MKTTFYGLCVATMVLVAFILAPIVFVGLLAGFAVSETGRHLSRGFRRLYRA